MLDSCLTCASKGAREAFSSWLASHAFLSTTPASASLRRSLISCLRSAISSLCCELVQTDASCLAAPTGLALSLGGDEEEAWALTGAGDALTPGDLAIAGRLLAPAGAPIVILVMQMNPSSASAASPIFIGIPPDQLEPVVGTSSRLATISLR